jgi:FHA domain
MPKIHLTTTDGNTLEFDITERVSFGRAEGNDILITDASVSSNHGEFAPHGDGLEITDKGSTNGTFINGERTQGGIVEAGGSFKLGSVEGHVVSEAADHSTQDEAEHHEDAAEAWSPHTGGGSAPTGLGATPCPSSMRIGFGPKQKVKDSAGTLIMTLGVLSLIVCGVAAFLISKMGGS